MIKALFCDFYGTVVYENGPLSYEVVKRLYQSGTGKSPEEVVGFWWKVFGQKLYDSFGENYHSQYELALESFEETADRFSAKEDPKEMCDMMVKHWCCPPIYDETKDFLKELKVPIYFVTNSDNLFIEAAVKHYALQPTGIITSEKARCSKPRKEIFLYALQEAGLKPEEVVHIGDSLRGDVQCPASVGIRALWLNREGQSVPEGITSIGCLAEAIKGL